MSVDQPSQPLPDAVPGQPKDPWGPGTGTLPVPATSHAPAVPPTAYAPAAASGPLGQVRSTGTCILLSIVTLGIYSWVWFYKTHEEMKQHTGQGLGGTIALVLAIFVGAAMPFLSSNEVGGLYERSGQAKPVSGLTGLWYFPGIFILVGPIVWFVKTNGALNEYWRSVGVR